MTGLSTVTHQGHACVRLAVQQGTALVALHGGQVLSWVPSGGRDVLWLSPQAQQPPSAIRGGVPICWPWFGKQGMPPGAMQHGPVRNRSWAVVGTPQVTPHRIQLELAPQPAQAADDPLARFAAGLEVRLRITLDDALTLELETRNANLSSFTLTQALHTYLAVGDVRQVTIHDLARVPYQDKLTQATGCIDPTAWTYAGPCDRIYEHPEHPHRTRSYAVDDLAQQRRIVLQTQGSRSVVLWNPGPSGAQAMADMPDDAWTQFVCLEATNAGNDAVDLPQGCVHTLTQRLSVAERLHAL